MNFILKHQRGFTLLEMLAATALLAIGLAIVINGMSGAMRGYVHDELKVRMALVANTLFAESSMEFLRLGTTEGIRDGIRWRLESSLQEKHADVGLYHLRLTLREGQREEQFNTLRVQRLAQEIR